MSDKFILLNDLFLHIASCCMVIFKKSWDSIYWQYYAVLGNYIHRGFVFSTNNDIIFAFCTNAAVGQLLAEVAWHGLVPETRVRFPDGPPQGPPKPFIPLICER